MTIEGNRTGVGGRIPLALALAGLALVVAPGMLSAGEGEISLRWALGSLGTAERSEPAIEGVEPLRFLIEPGSPSSVYLILLDADDAVHLVYREAWVNDAGQGQAHTPLGSGWIEVGGRTGLETLFLLAATEPLTDLEALLDRHDAAGDQEKDTLGAQIIEEIRRQNEAHREIPRPVEKPVMIAGPSVAGTDPDAPAVERLATEVNAVGFYSRTITIDH